MKIETKVNKLTGIIKTQIGNYENNIGLEINPSFAKRQKDIIDLVGDYWMSKYRDGTTDSSGYRKAFYNVIKNPVKVASKMIDLDTKDIKVIAEDGKSYYPSWFFGKELKKWMKHEKNKKGETFGQFLNQVVYSLPRYGHILVKKAGNTPYIVPLQNVVVDQSANRFLESDYIIEIHHYTDEQLRNEPWDEKKIEAIIKKKEKEDDKIVIYEIQGNVPGLKKNYFIFPKNATKNSEILVEQKKSRKELYKELKWDDIQGRALGIGVAEELFEAQIEKNINTNLLKAGTRWSSKHIFQTRDDSIANNLMTDIENGDLIIANSPIDPVDVRETNLSVYNDEDERWNKNIADISFAYEGVQGQRPPSGTPFGTTQLNTAMTGLYYEQKREEVGMFIRDIIFEWIIPEFEKTIKNEHEIMIEEFDENEVDILRNAIVSDDTNKAIAQFAKGNRRLPDKNEIEILKSISTEAYKRKKSLELPKSFYEDIKYRIDVVITGEQIDMGAKVASLQSVLQILGGNPTILQDKRTRNVFYQLLDMLGISPVTLGVEEEPGLADTMGQQQAKVAGSVAKPTPTQGVTNLPQRL